MPTPAFPDATALQQFLTDAGVYSSSPTFTALLTNAATQAALDVATDTGYVPFIATNADSTRTFTLERTRRLDLGAGLVSLTSLSINGAALTSGTDFYLEPANASAATQPYEWVDFVARRTTLPQAVSIVGKWGYIAYNVAMPQWAYDAALYRGAIIVSPTLLGKSGALVEEQYKDVRYKYAGDSQLSLWETMYDRIIHQRRRAVIE